MCCTSCSPKCYNKRHTQPIQIPIDRSVDNTTTDVSSVWTGASGGGNWQLSKLLGRMAMKPWFSPDTPRVFAPAAFAAFLQPLGYSIFNSLRTKSTISGTRSRPRIARMWLQRKGWDNLFRSGDVDIAPRASTHSGFLSLYLQPTYYVTTSQCKTGTSSVDTFAPMIVFLLRGSRAMVFLGTQTQNPLHPEHRICS